MRLTAGRCCLQVGHGSDSRHVWLWTVIRHLALNLEIIETLSLIQCVGVRGAPSSFRHELLSTWEGVIVCIRRWLLICSVIAALIICRILIVRVVNEALFLEEVAPAGLFRLIYLKVIVEGVVLDIDLPALIHSLQLFLNHADQAH